MLIVDSVQHAKAGHAGMALGMAEVAYFLYRHAMRYNSTSPKWFNRDRFVLSAGHACLLQLRLKTQSKVVERKLKMENLAKIEDLKCLCKLGSRTPGYPENVVTQGIEVTTGPLGQGVVNAVGLALAEANLGARYNKPDVAVVDHRTTDLALSEDISARFEALGWNTITIDNSQGNLDAFKNALISAHCETRKPTFIRFPIIPGAVVHCLLKTIIGKLSKKEGSSKAHHGTFDDDDVKQMKQKVKWNDREPFHVIPMVYREMQAQIDLGGRLEQEWNSKLNYYQNKYPEEAAEFKLLVADGMIPGWESSFPKWSMSDPVDSTGGYSGKCLNALAKVLPGLIGGSADLASSNQAYLHNLGDFKQPDSPWGQNIRYGVREHAMAGISNGLALHGGGLIPFAATFLVFSDYMKNSVRLSALSHAGVLYILTHDSVGIGEDGPTHQPIEHLSGLRAIPHLLLFRPADGKETAGAYKVAANVEGALADVVGKGGYIVSDNSEKELPEIILIGTGSELCLCEASANVLRKEGTRVRVVSLVCRRLFDRQPRDYKEFVLPSSVSKRVSVEAGLPLGWKEYVGDEGIATGIDDFGYSGPYSEVFNKYGFTEENVTKTTKSLLTK
ncbi:hypothetical protein H5410_002950 [Solanum commersonii]|uniref:transketolase n=1 Tax=Solanum commersonii TaxID=4109 RepID=A0A9J6B3F2_SOLCO|nr:hypothetical protein H5410_002950 [Solanum commersonii]